MDDGRLQATGDHAVLPVDLRELIARVAGTDAGVLLRGERGVGKQLFAREVHQQSRRRDAPFVRVNCAALADTIVDIESELFGHRRGAFSEATEPRTGHFEAADGGSIFLDEIAAIPVSIQIKLLQVLQEREVVPVGSTTAVPVDVRVFAATDRNVERLLHAGGLRADLYYRLQVIEIVVPPLRARRAEIVPLAEHFITRHAGLYQRPMVALEESDRDALVRHHWPGNILELENLMRRLVLLQDRTVLLNHLSGPAAAPTPVEQSVAPASTSARVNGDAARSLDLQSLARDAALRAERDAIDRALARFHWNRRKAAEFLNVSYKTLLNKMKECGISEVVRTGPAASRQARGNL
jgi:two-component system response regulator AtoC